MPLGSGRSKKLSSPCFEHLIKTHINFAVVLTQVHGKQFYFESRSAARLEFVDLSVNEFLSSIVPSTGLK